MMVVTHELGFARDVADRCIFMAEGAIVEEGPAQEFFSAPKTDRLKAFLSRPVREGDPDRRRDSV